MIKGAEYLVVEPQQEADACVIWLHGLGADGHDFAGIVDELSLPRDHSVRFIFPSAPFMPVTVNGGMRMRAWYDITDLNALRDEDEAGIKNSQELINQIINQQVVDGINAKRILLAGFSQGGAIALYTMLRFAHSLGGIIVLSAYMLLAANLQREAQDCNHATPIFMAHGMFDPIVPYQLGQQAYDLLRLHNYPAQWHSYPMVHTVCVEEIAAIGKFVRQCLNYA